MIRRFALTAFAVCLATCFQATAGAEEYAKFVDPHIGSGGHGHVFVGANVPFGAVQVGPNNFHQGWDWCSGYHYSDSIVVGFAQLHLSGTGIPDLGDVVLMPYTGEMTADRGKLKDPDAGYASRYSHDREEVRPGYYSVDLLDHDVKVELTATNRVTMHRYHLPEGKPAWVAVDLEYESGGGRATYTKLTQVDAHTLVGVRKSRGWAKNQQVYFAIKSEQAIASLKLFEGGQPVDGDSAEGKKTVGVINFAGDPATAQLKVGISPVSIENALGNIEADLDHWDFDKVAQAAWDAWNEELSVIDLKTTDESAKRVFYTALYHTMIAPVTFDDFNGEYRGSDREVHAGGDSTNYSIFSLWDTYRAAHPLYTITQPNRVPEFVDSMLAIYDEQGKLPVWHLVGNETNTMVGYHAVPVVVDAYFKGQLNGDPMRAYQAVRASAMRDERGLKFVKEIGYIPSEKENESVAKAMEYAIDDWCIAQMAKALGEQEDYEYFTKRAQYYRNYFDPETRFMRGKMSDGTWREPFNPFASTHRKDDYCEGNGWQYLWLVPQDPEGLIELLGGDEAFCDKLDLLFEQDEIKTEGASSDISGLIGQYAHGNEPGHHTTYLFAYAGQQWKSAKLVRQILTTLYHNDPDGLSGNEDCGQMSAWYLLSAMGMYPVNPSAGIYVFGSPLHEEVKINLPEGKSFKIVANNNSPTNVYIQSAKLNGRPYDKSYLTHSDLVAGGVLEFEMGPDPNGDFGAAPESRPVSKVFATAAGE